jgi:hypothetical protein
MDEGDGLPAGSEKLVFETFTRLEGLDRTGGTGLGLAIVKGLPKRWACKSRPPIAARARAPVSPLHMVPSQFWKVDRMKAAKILVTDDEMAIRRLLKAGLSRAGFAVVEAAMRERCSMRWPSTSPTSCCSTWACPIVTGWN